MYHVQGVTFVFVLETGDKGLHPAYSIQIAASRRQLDICELLLQQGAAVDINTLTFHTKR